ncbi:hypothetical protein GOODEAATRI_020390 [Goodea atripinnis]|uniref:Tuftelin n=1 Tax=Goodea atripinnis TaxID=208336 RepID=A0ABV0N390_9TELE
MTGRRFLIVSLRLRLTLHDQKEAIRSAEQHRDKPIGRAFALVQPPSERTASHPEPVKSKEEQVEIIKVRPHTNGWKVSIPFRKNGLSAPKTGSKTDGQAEGSRLRECLSDKEEKLRVTEEAGKGKDKRIEELQRLLGGMEQESATLRETIRSREDELCQLQKIREEGHQGQQRAEQLEKEVAILKEKIHHLDDMLKSQQRKVRHMIEQNSRMVIQERDRVIKELQEKLAYLEAENREMRDQMDYFLGGQRSNSYLSSERNPQIVYR